MVHDRAGVRSSRESHARSMLAFFFEHTAFADRSPGDEEPSFIAEMSFVRAPLNSRVTSNPALPKGKGKAKQDSLDRMPLEIQEAVILEDLLYVLMVR